MNELVAPAPGLSELVEDRPTTHPTHPGAFALVFVALALTACPGPGPGDAGVDAGPDAWPEGTLSLGGPGADGGFTPLAAELTAEPGSQGGYHVTVMYRVGGEALPGVVFEHRVTRSRDGVLVSKGSRTLDVTPTAAGQPWTTERGIIVFLCPTPLGVNIIDQGLTFQLTASRNGERLGTATATTVFRCGAGDTYCASVCRG